MLQGILKLISKIPGLGRLAPAAERVAATVEAVAPAVMDEAAAAAKIRTAQVATAEAQATMVGHQAELSGITLREAQRTARNAQLVRGAKWVAGGGAGVGVGVGTYAIVQETRREREENSPGNTVRQVADGIKEVFTENLGLGMGSLIGAGALAILGGFVGPVVAIAGALLGLFIGQPIFENISAAFKQSPTDPNAAGTGNTAGTQPAEQQAPGEQLHANVSANLRSTSPNGPRIT